VNERLLVSLLTAVEPVLVGVSLVELSSSTVESPSLVVAGTVVPAVVDELEEGSALEEGEVDEDGKAADDVSELELVEFALVTGVLLVEAEPSEEGAEPGPVADGAGAPLLFVSLHAGRANARAVPKVQDRWRDKFVR
jgi:hypothetical protein